MKLKLLYFGWVQSHIGVAGEDIEVADRLMTVAHLVDWLAQQAPGYAKALCERERLRFSRNYVYVDLSASIDDGDEIAIFPPVTGG